MKTAELTGAALDWAVAKCEGITEGKDKAWYYDRRDAYTYSTDWAQAGPIIERERIEISAHEPEDIQWIARDYWKEVQMVGPTPLVAACRCYVAVELGDEIEIPEQLV